MGQTTVEPLKIVCGSSDRWSWISTVEVSGCCFFEGICGDLGCRILNLECLCYEQAPAVHVTTVGIANDLSQELLILIG